MDNFDEVMRESENQFKVAKGEDGSKIEMLKKRYSIANLARGDKFLSSNAIFKQLSK